jgi:hypothetical protein
LAVAVSESLELVVDVEAVSRSVGLITGVEGSLVAARSCVGRRVYCCDLEELKERRVCRKSCISEGLVRWRRKRMGMRGREKKMELMKLTKKGLE